MIIETKRDLFTVGSEYYLAHCISSDCEMGAGIAVQFRKHFGLKDELLSLSEENRKHPTCIRVGRVFNLITKAKYWSKPTYESLEIALCNMRDQALELGIKYIATYRLGCCRDRLQWPIVSGILHRVFKGTDIEILICNL